MLPVTSVFAALLLMLPVVSALAGGGASSPQLQRLDFPGDAAQPASAREAIAARTQSRIRMNTPARRTTGVTQHTHTRGNETSSPRRDVRMRRLREGFA